MRRITLSLFASMLVALFVAAIASADANNNNSRKLRDAVTVEGLRAHQAALQTIATANDGRRASGTPGYDASVAYAADVLEAAGYEVVVQEFPFLLYEELVEEGREVSPSARDLQPEAMNFTDSTPAGGITAEIGVVPADADPGCQASDFASQSYAGKIALVQRGACTFATKAINAGNAGAAAVLIYNNAPGVVNGTLGFPNSVTIPAAGISDTSGADLIADTAGGTVPVTVFLNIQVRTEDTTTFNVLAEVRGTQNPEKVVMAGAHLDSVLAGPGINDNGSGSSVILEIAEQMAKTKPWNTVRFALWGGEESGLLGSTHYVNTLPAVEREKIALYLNFDMVGSPNFVRFVYDGDSSSTSGSNPAGSGQIEELFLDYFAAQGLATAPTEIGNRSDHAAFRNAGIPIGGLFTGAEGIKTPEQAAIFGGTAGIQYDPCYHQACDNFSNINVTVLGEMADAAAHAVITYAMNTSSIDGDRGKGNFNTVEKVEFQASQ